MNVCLGLMNRGDQEFLRRLRSDPHVAAWLFSRVRDISFKQQIEWFERTMKDDSRMVWVARRDPDQERVGYGQLYDMDSWHGSCEIGVVVAPEFQDHGVGKQITMRILDICFGPPCWVHHSLLAKVLAHNYRAVAMFRACGFQSRGWLPEAIYRDGKYLDMILMSITRRDYDCNFGARAGAHGD